MYLVYFGMSSANGLESFIKADEVETINSTGMGSDLGDIIFGKEENKKMTEKMRSMVSYMVMAARANPQRRSVAFRAKVTPELAELIEELYPKDPAEALIMLKKHASEIALAIGVPMAKKFWEQNPNPDIDPFK